MNKPKLAGPPFRIDEWDTKVVEGVTLSVDDRRLANDLNSTKRLEIEELREGLRIRSTSWIGVVRLSQVEIRVHPKLSGDNVRVVEMIEMTQGLDILKRMPGIREIDTTGRSLIDLLAMMLLHETERLIRGGLLSDYVEFIDDLPVLRGRILSDRQILERFGQLNRLICQFDERSQDVAENQLLAIGTQLCSRFATNEAIRRKARELTHVLRQACRPMAFEVRLGESQITYDRMNTRYKDAHQLSWLIVHMCGVKDFFESSTVTSFAFMLDMNLLFEEFVFSVLTRILDPREWRISKQNSTRSIVWNATTNRSYSSVRPDVLLRHRETGRALTIDSKYKLYDFRKISSADIYQSFLYAYGFQFDHGQDKPKSILIFPTTSEKPASVELELRGPAKQKLAGVEALGLQIPRVIDELSSDHGLNVNCLSRTIGKCLPGAKTESQI